MKIVPLVAYFNGIRTEVGTATVDTQSGLMTAEIEPLFAKALFPDILDHVSIGFDTDTTSEGGEHD